MQECPNDSRIKIPRKRKHRRRNTKISQKREGFNLKKSPENEKSPEILKRSRKRGNLDEIVFFSAGSEKS